jgi:regulator of protease activity HflC (stomatin/prohibitin superfamily)
MAIQPSQSSATERVISAWNGWPLLFLNIALLIGAAYLLNLADSAGGPAPMVGRLMGLICVAMLFGYFTLQPNEARVLILFGAYKGTVRKSGFHWANPLYARSRGKAQQNTALPNEGGRRNRLSGGRTQGATGVQALKSKISLRANNFNGDTLKVNDKRGNPVEIAAVVVWRVENTAQAVFDVEDYGNYVEVQSESALRTIASRHAYDQGEEHEVTLRSGSDEVALALKEELQVRLAKAGVAVEEARLTHLAYAPEIEKDVVKLDEERKAAMVSNLLVVLCGNSEASPVINAGTLYT